MNALVSNDDICNEYSTCFKTGSQRKIPNFTEFPAVEVWWKLIGRIARNSAKSDKSDEIFQR